MHIAPTAAKLLVEATPGDQLFAFLQSLGDVGRDLFRGFKISRKSTGWKVVCSRLVAELPRQPEVATLFLRWHPSPWGDWARAMRLVDPAWLKANWRFIPESKSSLCLLAAAATLDEGGSLVPLGERLLRRESLWASDWPGPDPPPAPPEWRSLRRVLRGSDALAVAPPPPAQQKNAKGDKHRKEKDEWRHRYDRTLVRARTVEQSLKDGETAWEAERGELKARLRAAVDRNTELEQDMDAKVAARVHQARRQILGLTAATRPWGEQAGPGWNPDLLDRVGQALETHRQLNDQYMRLSDLREQLERLNQARDRLAECMSESVVVLPGLSGLRDEVDTSIEDMRSLLWEHRHEGAPEAVQRLLTDVYSAAADADGLRRLDEIEQMLRIRPVRRLLGLRWVREVRDSLVDRRQAVETAQRERELAASAPEGGDPQTRAPREIMRVAQELGRLGEDIEVAFIVDAYNVIKQVPELAAVEEKQGQPAARDRLRDLCRAAARRVDTIELVFDGEGPVATREAEGGVALVFAPRRREDQNADDYIVARLPVLRQRADVIWLATEDQGLRERSTGGCDAFVAAADLFTFLTGQ